MYQIPNTIDYNFIIKFKTVIKEDIEFLSELFTISRKGSGYFELLESLILIKEQLLNLTSSYRLVENKFPNPPKCLPIEKHRYINTINQKTDTRILHILYLLERDQMIFIRNLLCNNKAPTGVNPIITEILEIYVKVTSQLERMNTLKHPTALKI